MSSTALDFTDQRGTKTYLKELQCQKKVERNSTKKNGSERMEHYFLGEMMRDRSVPAEGKMEEYL
jgi:hypothetical protein